MSGAYMLAVIIVAVIAMILAISKLKIHPFIVMTVIAIAVGLLCGMNTEDVIVKVKTGFGNILASIGIVILAGTIIGTILEKTGAALTMANTILKLADQPRACGAVEQIACGYGDGAQRGFVCDTLSRPSDAGPHRNGGHAQCEPRFGHRDRPPDLAAGNLYGYPVCKQSSRQNRYSG